MANKKGLTTFIVLAAALIFLSGASSNAIADEIKIGVQGVLSGVAAAIGDNARQGAELLAEQVNRAGGIKGNTIKLVVIDDKADPNDAVEAARRLIEADKVVAIANMGTSTTFLAASKIADRYKVPMVGHIQSDPEITKASPFAFRICVTAAGLAYPIAEYAIKEMGMKNFAVMTRNDGYGTSITEFFEKKVKELGGTLTAVQSYQPAEKDFKAYLIKIQGTKSDAVMLTGFFADSGLITKQAGELGLTSRIIGQNTLTAPSYRKIAGVASEGAIFSANYLPGVVRTEAADKFIQDWEKKYGKEPEVYAAHGYDALAVILEAIKMGEPTATSIQKNLFKITNFDGASGTIKKFNANGDVEKDVVIVKIEGDKLNALKTYLVTE
jgi:branched-chain amino acid transport system substrate-binding protein